MEIKIPIRFSRPIAARLLGVSLPTFDALRLAPVSYPRVHKRYLREVVEEKLGRPVTAEMIADAEQRHAARKAQRN